jgi:hypothetical protein
MELDREVLVEAFVATLPVVVLVALMVYAGQQYTTNGGLTATGGKVLVGAIVAFLVLVVGLGYWLAYSDY